MDTALSLKSGDVVPANGATYKTSKDLLLVCPECGEPVHLAIRESPYNTPFFVHPKELPSLKLIKGCSLRVDGGEFRKASHSITGLSHGQLVDRFQREFAKELYGSLGVYSKRLFEFIKFSRFTRLSKASYGSLVRTINSEAPGDEILSKGLTESQMTTYRSGIDDICLFLKSPYGVWIGNFVYQTAYFIACILHPGAINKSLGQGVFSVRNSHALFVAESFRIKKSNEYAMEILPRTSRRNTYIPRISAILVSFLIFKWRFKSTIPRFLVVADDNFDKSPTDLAAVEKRPSHIQNKGGAKLKNLRVENQPAQSALPATSTEAITSKAIKSAANSKMLSNLDPKNWINSAAHSTNYSANPVRSWRSENVSSSPSKSTIDQMEGYRNGALTNRFVERPVTRNIASKHPSFSMDSSEAAKSANLSPLQNFASKNGSPSNTSIQPKNVNSSKFLTEEDKARIVRLVELGKTLRTGPSVYGSRQILMAWSGLKNPFEAHFLAALLSKQFNAHPFNDNTLNAKLQTWLDWAETTYSQQD